MCFQCKWSFKVNTKFSSEKQYCISITVKVLWCQKCQLMKKLAPLYLLSVQMEYELLNSRKSGHLVCVKCAKKIVACNVELLLNAIIWFFFLIWPSKSGFLYDIGFSILLRTQYRFTQWNASLDRDIFCEFVKSCMKGFGKLL